MLPQRRAVDVAPRSHRYLNRSTCFDLPGMDNAKEYAATRRSMDVVGIPPVDQVCAQF